LKIIVLAVTAASKSTDNAVTAITQAILDSRNIVITNKLDDESLKQLQTKYDTYYQQEETLYKKHGIDIAQMLERNKDRCYEIINHGDGSISGGKPSCGCTSSSAPVLASYSWRLSMSC